MRSGRVEFCGVIQGSVARRRGETSDQALERAEATIQALLDRGAKRFAWDASKYLGCGAGGPIVSLELDDTPTLP